MTTILIWLNKNQKPEIKCSGFSDIWMNLKRIHDIIEVALLWRCKSGKSEKNGRD